MTVQIPDPVSNVASAAKVIAVVVLVLAIVGVIGYLAYTKSQLEKQITQDATLISDLQNSNADWKTQTDAANEAVKKAQTEAVAAQAQAEAAQQVAIRVDSAYGDAAKTIEATKPQGDECAATKALVDSFYKVKK